MNDFGSSARNKKSFLCLIRNAKTSLSTGICAASSKNGEFLKMRFFIAAVVAFATMTLDFESFKLNYGLHGMTRSAFTVAAGYAGEEDKLEPAEHSVRTEAAAHPAESSDIPVAFFARLLWQESRFQAFEVSRVGAQGVAQFMPATAAEVGLDDPFDPFKALPASAKFLRKLHNEFGNLGLAAAAYNAGSGRIQKWLSGRSALPRETRDYVRIITGNNAENWLEESRTLSLHLELPRGAPCEGVGGLSKATEVAAIPVALAPSISDAIKKAETEAQRANAAKLEAAAKAKT